MCIAGCRSVIALADFAARFHLHWHADERTGALGDGDPLDVCDIGTQRAATTGSVYPVKIIGALAMLDGGETDWKLLAIRADDPLAAQVDDVAGATGAAGQLPDAVLRAMDDIREWFRTYKIPEGKGENTFAFSGAWQGRDTAHAVIAACQGQWSGLIGGRAAAASTNVYGYAALAGTFAARCSRW